MWRNHGLLVTAMAAVALGVAGCGDSGPEGPNAGFVDSMEKLGVSHEQAEREAREIDRQVARESRRREARFQRELKQEEGRRAQEGSDPAPQPTQESSPDSAGGFTGKYAPRYEEDRIVCGLVPHSQIAREFGIASTASPLEVAEAYAEGFYGRFEQAAFEGCLAGIQNRLEK